MAELSGSQSQFLARLARTQRLSSGFGVLLVAVGVLYAGWGYARFEPRGDPREAPGFDRPVAQLAFLYEPLQSNLERVESITLAEHQLRGTLSRGMAWSAGLLMLVVRLFIGVLVALAGLVMMTVVVERRRLLRIIERLRS
jgi:hypothetical protein